MDPFAVAFNDLLRRAPGPIFPRARALYFRKYPLEGRGSAPFATYLMEERVEEPAELLGQAYLVQAVRFAIVYWEGQERQTPIDFSGYLQRQWQLDPVDLSSASDLWFRGEGQYASFSAIASYTSSG